MIPSQRHLFEIPDEIAYLNCAYMAPQMKAVSAAGVEGLKRKANPWRISAQDFFSEAAEARRLFAELIGASAADVAIVPSASYGIAVAAANVPAVAGDRILLLEDQFPSNVYAWLELARSAGAEVVTVARPPDMDWTNALLREVDEKTAVVAIPHVHWTDGTRVDLEAVGAACRDVDAALVLDATQSVGALPFSVQAVQPDFLIAAAYKWLLGPYGLAFMYVSERFQDSQPIEHNWITRKNSEDFSGLVRYTDEFQEGAVRFDVGQRSNFTLLPMAIAALKQVHRWTVADIAGTLTALTTELAHGATELGLRVAPESHRSPHLIGLGFPGRMPDRLLQELADNHIYVSIRGTSMRVSPHVYNTLKDVRRLLEVLENIVRTPAARAL